VVGLRSSMLLAMAELLRDLSGTCDGSVAAGSGCGRGEGACTLTPPQRTSDLELERTKGIRLFN